MPVNRDKPDLWKPDIARSVDMYNDWFIKFAPKAFRDSRAVAVSDVEAALKATSNLLWMTPDVLHEHPAMLPVLRMSTCPPLARDRLIGLAGVSGNLVGCMDKFGVLPSRMDPTQLENDLQRIVSTISKMIDPDIFTWIESKQKVSRHEVLRAATVVADRLCGAVADPIVRNAQEKRQLAAIATWLENRGYKPLPIGKGTKHSDMPAGTYSFRLNVPIKMDGGKIINIPVDAVIQRKTSRAGAMPVLIEAKSAGDFTNVNKRRKEEAVKIQQLRATYGPKTQLCLFLCGYFDSGYLGYEAAEGIDWVWEHRIDDLALLGL